jgi:hypothetical protein
VQVAAAIKEQGVAVPPQVEDQLQPSCPLQDAGPLNRLQDHDSPLQEFVALSQMHPWMLMHEKSLNSEKQL